MDNREYSNETHSREGLGDTDEPQFGAIDIVEAFTALRHEWRGQTRETRALAEALQTAVSEIGRLESSLKAQAATAASDSPESIRQNRAARQLVETIVDIDHQLTRAIAAVAQTEAARADQASNEVAEIRQFFDQMNPVARWFSRPLLVFVLRRSESSASTDSGQTDTSRTVEGLNLVLARLRRTMQEQQIERIDTVGHPFDPQTMNAIEAASTNEVPSGHVLEQLMPGYRWRGELLRFAEVRVAR